mmetsp:Transcript_4545/g.12049  ORF Transcript_4545/g.12049 Transcript_4545/m.12049 type:complete len:281 (+) Transcript_4545:508-1350(+)
MRARARESLHYTPSPPPSAGVPASTRRDRSVHLAGSDHFGAAPSPSSSLGLGGRPGVSSSLGLRGRPGGSGGGLPEGCGALLAVLDGCRCSLLRLLADLLHLLARFRLNLFRLAVAVRQCLVGGDGLLGSRLLLLGRGGLGLVRRLARALKLLARVLVLSLEELDLVLESPLLVKVEEEGLVELGLLGELAAQVVGDRLLEAVSGLDRRARLPFGLAQQPLRLTIDLVGLSLASRACRARLRLRSPEDGRLLTVGILEQPIALGLPRAHRLRSLGLKLRY